MNIKSILILIFVCYFLVLLQTTFLVPNLILILVILWNFIEKSKNYFGIYSALISGFFLDIFSSRPIGFYILILLVSAIFIKFFIKKYVRIPAIERA